MEIVKKNLVSIIMGVVAILGVVAIYVWPIPGLYVTLGTELRSRLIVGGQVSGLLKAQRTLPLLRIDTTVQDPLNTFPNERVIEAGNNALTALTNRANEMFQVAVKANQHDLLTPTELPNPQDKDKYDYAEKYVAETKGYARWRAILNALGKPTAAEITQAQADKRAAINSQYLIQLPNGGGIDPDSQKIADAEYKTELPSIASDVQKLRAMQISCYLEDKVLQGVDTTNINVTNTQNMTPAMIFDTQMNIWCIDDVCHAIADCNKTYSDPAVPGGPPVDDALHAPIKMLEIMTPYSAQAGGTAQPDIHTALVKYAPASDTERVCNAMYDVVRYQIRLVVDAEKLPLVIRQFQANRFLTVQMVQIVQVMDPAVQAVAGYRFGDKPCLEVEFRCEELFLHQWTDPILPDSRKPNLGNQGNSDIDIDAANAAAATPDQSGGDPNATPDQGGR
jgi:hypothetical protein